MPSTSKKQARFMAACSHGADYSSCPPDKVSKEFNQADKDTGILKKKDTNSSMAVTKRGHHTYKMPK